MRKLVASALGAAALAVVPLSVTGTPAVAEPAADQVNGPIAVAVCRLFQQLDPTAFDARFKNLGKCVSFLNHPPTPTPTTTPTPTPS